MVELVTMGVIMGIYNELNMYIYRSAMEVQLEYNLCMIFQQTMFDYQRPVGRFFNTYF